MKLTFCSFTLLLIMQSCSKVDIKEDAPLLIGEWQWHYSVRTFDTYQPPPHYTQIIQEDVEYSLEIKKNGKIKWFKYVQEIGSERIKELSFSQMPAIAPFDNYSSYGFNFEIDLYWMEHWKGLVSEDSLKLQSMYPFRDNQGNDYVNYFYRK